MDLVTGLVGSVTVFSVLWVGYASVWEIPVVPFGLFKCLKHRMSSDWRRDILPALGSGLGLPHGPKSGWVCDGLLGKKTSKSVALGINELKLRP